MPDLEPRSDELAAAIEHLSSFAHDSYLAELDRSEHPES